MGTSSRYINVCPKCGNFFCKSVEGSQIEIGYTKCGSRFDIKHTKDGLIIKEKDLKYNK